MLPQTLGVGVNFSLPNNPKFTPTRFSATATANRSSATVAGRAACQSALQRLRWYRLGGEVSDRQWRDVAAIVGVQGSRLDLVLADGGNADSR
jgi:hypothetical protein